jgi:hypothetical protein
VTRASVSVVWSDKLSLPILVVPSLICAKIANACLDLLVRHGPLLDFATFPCGHDVHCVAAARVYVPNEQF